MEEFAFSRIEIAIEQLDLAIEHFLSERSLVSALTLAGAAEEILGVAAKNNLTLVPNGPLTPVTFL